MAEWVRECAQCHHIDFTHRFARKEEAESAAEAGQRWSCERCGGREAVAVLDEPVGGG